MLRIVTNNGINEKFSIGNLLPNIDTLTKVVAEGESLIYIRAHFTNIPMSFNNDWVQWEGEMARFILHNL